MDDIEHYISYTIGAIVFLIIAIFFKLYETSSSQVSEGRLKQLITNDENKKAKKMLELKRNIKDLNLKLTTITALGLIGSTSFLVFVYSTPMIMFIQKVYLSLIGSDLITTESYEQIETIFLISEISMVVTTILTCILTITFGSALPRKLDLKNSENLALNLTPMAKVGLSFFSPFTYTVITINRIILTVLKIDPDIQSADLTEDEIRSLVDEGNENGMIDHSEKEMINNIFDFDERTIDEIMTHRTDIVACSKNDEIHKIIDVAINDGFSRIPIYEEDIDDIIGVIYAKDLLTLYNDEHGKNKTTLDFMRSILYIPETAKCEYVFKTFKAKKTHFAVVVDEYGGTSGVVTMEDLLESIVGSIQDEYDDEEDEDIIKLSETSYILNGGLPVEKVAKVLKRNIDIDENYDTLRGLISSMLEKLSVHNEHKSVLIDDVLFVVLSVEDRKIMNIRAEIKPKQDEDVKL